MRKRIEIQPKLGTIAIGDIHIDIHSRDEIPKILLGLQHIFVTPSVRNLILSKLESVFPKHVSQNKGRTGMSHWQILVLGMIRLGCNIDYDKLQELANNHKVIRHMLQHGDLDEHFRYGLQTLKDNLGLFTEELLRDLNQIVVEAGHKAIRHKVGVDLQGRCDSFPVQTNVHFPTDLSLLFDSMRKVITLLAVLCLKYKVRGWRQSTHNLRTIKKLYRKCQKLRHSTSKDEAVKEKRAKLVVEAYESYVECVESFLLRADAVWVEVVPFLTDLSELARFSAIEHYAKHARKQIDLIRRRVCNGEKIPHAEKVFSIFEEHTEWLSKGKAGVSQELGLNVCIVEDSYCFILNWKVMEKESDVKVAVPLIQATSKKHADFRSCSFDKGFHSPENQNELGSLLEKVILPKKGKLSKEGKKVEGTEEFRGRRRRHSAVESGINALEHSGLDRCPDHGIKGFKRYVALAVLARNLQTLGNIIQKKKLKQAKRQILKEAA